MIKPHAPRQCATSDERYAHRALRMRIHRAPPLALGTHVMKAVAPPDVRYEDIARLVHDFKNPLSTISLESQLLEHRLGAPAPLEVHRASERILRNVEFLDRMVMDLLDLCAVKTGHLELQRAPTEVHALLQRIVERVVPSRDSSRVTLESSGRTVLDLDALRIERVVANLLGNALKYAPAATRVTVRLEQEPTLVRISVLDEGSSLTDLEMACLFEAYRRGHHGVVAEGSGLGLFVSKRIVEAHGGAIGVDRRSLGGTRFYFELPIAPAVTP